MEYPMNADKQHAHQLIEQLGSSQLAAILQLLEVMVDPVRQSEDEEALTAEDRQAVVASREWYQQHPEGIPFEQVVAECGLTLEDVQR
jgi:hypothetical protein